MHNWDPKKYKFETLTIHAGQQPDPTTGAIMTPIYQTSTYVQESPGKHKGFEYSRTHNPTRNAYEANLAALEKGKHGLAFASGVAATATVMHLFKSGDHVICSDDVYGGTNRLFNRVIANNGIQFSMVDLADLNRLRESIKPNTRLVWVETPTNPTLKIIDIAAVAKVCHEKKVLVAVDNTFMSPYFQKPITLGADIAMHSTTKFVNGHSDMVGGALIVNDDELNTKLRFLQNSIGAVQGPFDSWLAMRGLKTLAVRMKQHDLNAMAIARYLERHSDVQKVAYPGLESHPQHLIAKKQMSGFGGMITFWIKGGLSASRSFLEKVRIFSLAESLGGVESLIEHPAIMTHASVPPEQRKLLGIDDSMIRLSVGIEHVDDLLADLERAFKG